MAVGFPRQGRFGRLAGRLAAALLLTLGLSACAIPPAISIASIAADGVLLATTGKSKADHGLSFATGKDCLTFRVIDGEDICRDEVVAQAEPPPAEPDLAQSPAAPPSVAEPAEAALAVAHVRPAMAAPWPAPKVQLASLRPKAGGKPGGVKFDRIPHRPPVVAVSAHSVKAPGKVKALAALKGKGKGLAAVKVKAKPRLAAHSGKPPRAKALRAAARTPPIRLALLR